VLGQQLLGADEALLPQPLQRGEAGAELELPGEMAA